MPEITVFNLPRPQETKTFKITPRDKPNQECLLGRDDHCCVVLNDMKISRLHGKITFSNGTYYYTDLGSRNGSQINNKRVKANQNYALKSSDTIALGNHLIWIKALSKRSASQGADQQESPSAYHYLSSQQDLPLATAPEISRPKEEKLKVNCVQVINETHNVKTFRFVVDSPGLFNYKPGQFVTLQLNIRGKLVKRCYTISSTPSRPYTLDITIKLVHFLAEDNSSVSLIKKFPKSSELPNPIAGLVNNLLYKKLGVGSKITISQPMGKFPDFANLSQKLLLISAGIGISTLMSITRWLCDTVSNVDIIFVHSARTPKDIIFLKELELMALRYPNFKLVITVTRPEAGSSWYGYTGRLNGAILPAIAPDYQERNVYVCGSDSFRKTMKSLMQGLSLPMENYYEETLDISRNVKQNLPQFTSMAKVKPLTSQAKSLDIVAKASQNDNYLTIKPKAVNSSLPCTKVPAATVATPVKLAHFPSNGGSFTKKAEEARVGGSRYKGGNPGNALPWEPAERTGWGMSSKRASPGALVKSEPIKTKMPIVLFAKSGKEITCDGEKSILDHALAQGIDLPSGCGMGVCGQCKLKRISGKVVYDDEDLSCEDSHVLTCIAKAEGKVVLEG